MITIEQLREWSNENKKKELIAEIEKYIDNKIERQTLEGKLKIRISTGYPDIHRGRALKSSFYKLWCNENVSRGTLSYIRNAVIEKYQSIGLLVEEMMFDEGWNQTFEGLLIEIPKSLLDEQENK